MFTFIAESNEQYLNKTNKQKQKKTEKANLVMMVFLKPSKYIIVIKTDRTTVQKFEEK